MFIQKIYRLWLIPRLLLFEYDELVDKLISKVKNVVSAVRRYNTINDQLMSTVTQVEEKF